MGILFLDECGYTGQDLLNKQQPIFTLASLHLEEAECRKLLDYYFSGIRAKEIKHSAIIGRRGQEKLVLDFLDYITEREELVKFSLVHKRFAIVCKMVDAIMEEAMFKSGLDLYDRGGNIALSHVFFYCIPALEGEDFFETLLQKFQILFRVKDKQSCEEFFEFVFNHQCQNGEAVISMLRYALYQLGIDEIISNDINLDVAFPSALNLMAIWRKSTSEKFSLIHDSSSNMSRVKDLWDLIVDPKIPKALVGYDRRTWEFPIAIEGTSFEKSEDWAGLQLCDVLAGSLNYYARWLCNNKDNSDIYGKQLNQYYHKINSISPLWPSPNVTPEELETNIENKNDFLHFLGKILVAKAIISD